MNFATLFRHSFRGSWGGLSFVFRHRLLESNVRILHTNSRQFQYPPKCNVPARFIGTLRQRRLYPKATKAQSLLVYIQKQLVFVKGFMLKKRQTKHPYLKDLFPIYTFSNVAGHGAFLCLAISYMESDFMMLRIYAATGISLSIVFQVDWFSLSLLSIFPSFLPSFLFPLFFPSFVLSFVLSFYLPKLLW